MHLVALGARLIIGEVGNPHVAVGVDVDTVGRHHDAAAEICEDFAGVTVELEDWIDRVGVAVDWRATAKGACAAALIGPDVAIVRIDVDAGRRSPISSRRQIAPILGDIRVWIRQTLARDGVALGHSPGIATPREQDRDTG